MIDLKKEFEQVGSKGVNLYKMSLIDNNRVATGKTKDSIRFEAKPNTLTFYALDHIRDIETGQTKEQVKKNSLKGDFYQKIETWIKARQIRRSPDSIISGLLDKGWEGTPGIITNVDDLVLKIAKESTKKTIAKQASNQILNSLKAIKQ